MENDLIISFCGDVCSECPRYIATKANDIQRLKRIAELWVKLGFRNEILNPDDLKCSGCNKNMICSHGINTCEHLNTKKNCGKCDYFPCDKINAVFQKTENTEVYCREKCTESEYLQLKKAYLMKREILTKINRDLKSGST